MAYNAASYFNPNQRGTVSGIIGGLLDTYVLAPARMKQAMEYQQQGFDQRGSFYDQATETMGQREREDQQSSNPINIALEAISGRAGGHSQPLNMQHAQLPVISQAAENYKTRNRYVPPNQSEYDDTSVMKATVGVATSPTPGNGYSKSIPKVNPKVHMSNILGKLSTLETGQAANMLDRLSPGSIAEFGHRVGEPDMFKNFQNNQYGLREKYMGEAGAMDRHRTIKPSIQTSGLEGNPNMQVPMMFDGQRFNPIPGAYPLKRNSGTTVNVGGQSGTIKPADALKMFRHPDASPGPLHPPIGADYGDSTIRDNYSYDAPSTDKLVTEAMKSSAIVNNLEEALGKVYDNRGNSMDDSAYDRLKFTLDTNLERFIQTNPDIKSYVDFAEGTLAPLVRSLGTVGNLSDTDLALAEGLVPQITGIFPDTEEVAAEKIRKLRSLITSGMREGQITKGMLYTVLDKSKDEGSSGDGSLTPAEEEELRQLEKELGIGQ